MFDNFLDRISGWAEGSHEAAASVDEDLNSLWSTTSSEALDGGKGLLDSLKDWGSSWAEGSHEAAASMDEDLGQLAQGAGSWFSDLIPDLADFIPDWLLPVGLGGGGLLAGLLGFRLFRMFTKGGGKQSRPADLVSYVIPTVQKMVTDMLQQRGILVQDVQVMGDKTIFTVPVFHTGKVERMLGMLKVQWRKAG